MIYRRTFDDGGDINRKLNACPSVYSIDSILDNDLKYGIKNGLFAVMRHGDAIVCDVTDIPEIASWFKSKIKQEILDIYEDIRDLRLGEVW